MIGDAFGFLDPLYSSGVLLALKSGEFAADAIAEGLRNGNTSGITTRQMGGPLQQGSRPDAPARLRVLRRIQLRRICEKLSSDLQGTVTDVLIGDVFDGHVDKLWGPMESLYEAGKSPIPSWDAGIPAEKIPEKATNWFYPRIEASS